MVNTQSRREDQDASMIAPSERGPQPQEDTSGNQEANFRLSIMADIKQMFQDQNRELIHKMVEESMRSILNGRVTKPNAYKRFLSCQSPEFSGSADPTAILTWIIEMEQTFDLCECEEAQKVKFAVRMLKGNASAWWNMTWVMLGQETASHLTWSEFVERVKKKYCAGRDLYEIGREFYTLEKGDMTIDEYACLFVEKLQFVGHWVPTDKDRVDHFAAGLPYGYHVVVGMAKDLDSAIRKAKRVEEEEENGEGGDVGEKRKWEGETLLGSNLNKSKRGGQILLQLREGGTLGSRVYT